MMAPQLERAAQLRPRYRFAKVNVDEQPALADAFQVRSIRTLAGLRDGELLGIAPGLVGANDLVTAIDKAAAQECRPSRGWRREPPVILLAIPFGLVIGLIVGAVGGGGAILALPVLSTSSTSPSAPRPRLR